jgi:protein required for attachment to host cells
MAGIPTLVVIADGGTARFFTWPESGGYLAEHKHLRMDVSPAEGERDRTPRVQDSTGHHRHRIERRQSAHQAHEEKFLVEAADRIAALMAEFSATSLVLCAPPKALGSLRVALSKAGKDFKLTTLAKDLTKETPEQLDHRVRRLRALKPAGNPS